MEKTPVIIAIVCFANLLVSVHSENCSINIPTRCSCSEVVSDHPRLFCNLSGESTWPSFSMDNYTEVAIVGPAIFGVLTKDMLYFKTRRLVLQNLGIHDIHYAAFVNTADMLQNINLDYNELNYFPAFYSLKQPNISISIRNNLLTSLAKTWIPDYIGILDLQYNNMGYIHPDFFHPTNNITILDLSYNNLGNGDFISITKLGQLQRLVIANNKLTKLQRSLSSENLVELNFRNNSIGFINSTFFYGDIQTLDLSYNSLTDVDIQGVTKLKKIQSLKIGHNLLSEESFHKIYEQIIGISGFYNLEMNNNRITRIRETRNLTLRICESPLPYRIILRNNSIVSFPDVLIKCAPDRTSSTKTNKHFELDLANNKLKRIPKLYISETFFTKKINATINLTSNRIYGSNLITFDNAFSSVNLLLEKNTISGVLIDSKSTSNHRNRSFHLLINLRRNLLAVPPQLRITSPWQLSLFNVQILMSSNRLTKMSNLQDAIIVSPKPGKLDVTWEADDNPFVCDCEMLWVRNSTYFSLRTSICKSPWCGYFIGCFPLSNCQSYPSTVAFVNYCKIPKKEGINCNVTLATKAGSQLETIAIALPVSFFVIITIIVIGLVVFCKHRQCGCVLRRVSLVAKDDEHIYETLRIRKSAPSAAIKPKVMDVGHDNYGLSEDTSAITNYVSMTGKPDTYEIFKEDKPNKVDVVELGKNELTNQSDLGYVVMEKPQGDGEDCTAIDEKYTDKIECDDGNVEIETEKDNGDTTTNCPVVLQSSGNDTGTNTISCDVECKIHEDGDTIKVDPNEKPNLIEDSNIDMTSTRTSIDSSHSNSPSIDEIVPSSSRQNSITFMDNSIDFSELWDTAKERTSCDEGQSYV